MGTELEEEAKKLAGALIASLKGRARELYESRVDIRDLVVRTTRNAAKLALELAREKDEDRKENLRESLKTAEDTVANEVAALYQDVVTEAASWFTSALQMLISVAREAAPLVAKFVREKTQDE